MPKIPFVMEKDGVVFDVSGPEQPARNAHRKIYKVVLSRGQTHLGEWIVDVTWDVTDERPEFTEARIGDTILALVRAKFQAQEYEGTIVVNQTTVDLLLGTRHRD